MSRHLFSAALCCFLLCHGRGAAHAASPAQRANTAELFVPEVTVAHRAEKDGEGPKQNATMFFSPLFVGGDDVMVAFAAAFYIDMDTKISAGETEIMATCLRAQGEGWAKRATEGNGANWWTHVVTQEKDDAYVFGDFVAAIKENKIYLLVTNIKIVIDDNKSKKRPDWGFQLITGEIKDEAGTKEKRIYWGTPESLNDIVSEQFQGNWVDIPPPSGSAFQTEDGRIVFVIRTKNNKNKDVSTIIHFSGIGEKKKWELSRVECGENCSFSALFMWEGKLVMAPVNCQTDNHKMRESTDMGKTWNDATGPISHLWDNLRDKKDFTTAIIENKSVLLYTEYRNVGTEKAKRLEVYLWFSDGTRAHNAGMILAGDVNDIASGGLVCTNGELFFFHQGMSKENSDRFLVTHLEDKQETIKSTLKTWDEKDAHLSKSCRGTTSCLTPMPTDGLVGFLSNKGDGTHWHDEYLFSDAEVKGGTKVKNGYTFRGANSGAQWSLGQQEKTKRYNFARYGTTVVATVTLHKTPESDAPLLTVGGVEVDERLGLWYKYKQWKMVSKNGREEPVTELNTQKAHRVAIVLKSDTISLYVDGKPLGKPLTISVPWEEPFKLQNIFIGGYGLESEIHMTVTNVFLYNRPFTDTEIKTVGDSSARVGATLLLLLGLWGLVAPC